MSLLTSAPLHLTYAGGLYDRTAPLATGEVRPEGIDLNYVPVVPPEAFWRQLKHNEFDVSEMSCANYLTVFSRGDRRFVAIPVYPSRTFRHSAVYINPANGIKRAEDLKGRRIGCAEYYMTMAIWQRAFLQHDYGVAPADVRWVLGGVEQPGRREAHRREAAGGRSGRVGARGHIVVGPAGGRPDRRAAVAAHAARLSPARSARGPPVPRFLERRARVLPEAQGLPDHALGRGQAPDLRAPTLDRRQPVQGVLPGQGPGRRAHVRQRRAHGEPGLARRPLGAGARAAWRRSVVVRFSQQLPRPRHAEASPAGAGSARARLRAGGGVRARLKRSGSRLTRRRRDGRPTSGRSIPFLSTSSQLSTAPEFHGVTRSHGCRPQIERSIRASRRRTQRSLVFDRVARASRRARTHLVRPIQALTSPIECS